MELYRILHTCHVEASTRQIGPTDLHMINCRFMFPADNMLDLFESEGWVVFGVDMTEFGTKATPTPHYRNGCCPIHVHNFVFVVFFCSQMPIGITQEKMQPSVFARENMGGFTSAVVVLHFRRLRTNRN